MHQPGFAAIFAGIMLTVGLSGCLGGGGDGEALTIVDDYPVIGKNAGWQQLDVLANDLLQGAEVTITAITTPSHGSARINGSKIDYMPSTDFTGVDSFVYRVETRDGDFYSGEVAVVVADQHPIALIDTSQGMIVAELYQDKMPRTTNNFIQLAVHDFYDGLLFHRVVPGFVIQGGGFYPNATYKESPYGTIAFESHPHVTHVDGALSMARGTSKDSATSQFFICNGPQPQLNGEYAAFGRVIKGMDVVHSIAQVKTTTRSGMENWPVTPQVITSITIRNR